MSRLPELADDTKAANRHNLVVDGMPVKEWAEDMRARLLEIAAKEQP